MQDAKPPTREPHYGDNETHGWTQRQCAINLIGTLSWWCKQPLEFKGDANGRIWHFEGEFADHAQLRFTSNLGDGAIAFSVHETNWVLAELSIGGELKFRCWLEDPYEEKEFYPDGSDGKPNAEGDPPGRISKRGRWLQIRCADFPGVPDGGGGFWSLEDTFD